jgi:hypothetical protein
MKAWRIKLSEEAIRQRLQMLERWKASGLPKKAWAQAQGVDMAVLVSASGYEARWRARLAGQSSPTKVKVEGFAAVRKVSDQKGAVRSTGVHETVRIECAGVVMHWPVSRGAELAQWLYSLKVEVA